MMLAFIAENETKYIVNEDISSSDQSNMLYLMMELM